jgi:hypothetical protein
MKTEQERIEYLLKNPHLVREPVGTTPDLRDYTSNCHGISLWIKNKDCLLKSWGNLVKLIEEKPGFISNFAMEGFLTKNKRVREIKEPAKRELITLWEYSDYGRGPDELRIIHSGIWTGNNILFHLNGIYNERKKQGGKLEYLKLNELVPPHEKERTIIRYFKII